MSDYTTRQNPRTGAGGQDPDATHWTAKDAREAFGPGAGRGSGAAAGSGVSQTPAGSPHSAQPTQSAPEPQAPASPQSGLRGVSAAAGASAPARSAGSHGIRRTRKARLRISRVDPWSVMKTSLLFGVAGAIIFFVAVWVVWGVIGASGAFDSMNKAVNDLIASPTSQDKFQLSDYLNTGRVLGLTAIIGAVDAVLFTALATLFSFLYNLAAQVMGGLEVTLAED
ncbi:DUF3566 domain-containing protein [Acidipropionibacterium jensenii]|uniref:DUF3566 domain-containing protein n=1 Tax=Acidipropionibacterium jensenii TaxID=1749 RepID=UPI0035A3B4BE